MNHSSLAAMLTIALAAGAALAEPPPTRVQLPVPQPAPPPGPDLARRYPVLPGLAADWPSLAPAEIVTRPDWGDYHVYPGAARLRDQEGRVGMAVLIGADGVPTACRIVTSSGYAALDDGTCDLGLTMRFRSPLGADGRPARSVYRVHIRWELGDPVPFLPARMIATLDLEDGRVVGCRTGRSPYASPDWDRDGCRAIRNDLGHFLGPGTRGATRATIAFVLRPTGDATAWEALPGRPVAARRIAFALSPAGDAHDCRILADRGFGPHQVDYFGTCGFFLRQTWFETGPKGVAPQDGVLEIAVQVEP